MLAVPHEWRRAVSNTEGDDFPMLVYCDWLSENGGGDLEQILRQWINVRTPIRTSPVTDFDKLVEAYNQQYDFPDREIIETRKAWMSGRIGGCYTHLHATPEYLRKRPNLLSGQPFRTLTLLASRADQADQADLDDVATNWRLGKLWHLDIPFYQFWGNSEEKLVQMIRRMKPLHSLNHLRIQGVRDLNFKLSSSLIGLKKISKGCRLKLGNQKEMTA